MRGVIDYLLTPRWAPGPSMLIHTVWLIVHRATVRRETTEELQDQHRRDQQHMANQLEFYKQGYQRECEWASEAWSKIRRLEYELEVARHQQRG